MLLAIALTATWQVTEQSKEISAWMDCVEQGTIEFGPLRIPVESAASAAVFKCRRFADRYAAAVQASLPDPQSLTTVAEARRQALQIEARNMEFARAIISKRRKEVGRSDYR